MPFAKVFRKYLSRWKVKQTEVGFSSQSKAASIHLKSFFIYLFVVLLVKSNQLDGLVTSLKIISRRIGLFLSFSRGYYARAQLGDIAKHSTRIYLIERVSYGVCETTFCDAKNERVDFRMKCAHKRKRKRQPWQKFLLLFFLFNCSVFLFFFQLIICFYWRALKLEPLLS